MTISDILWAQISLLSKLKWPVSVISKTLKVDRKVVYYWRCRDCPPQRTRKKTNLGRTTKRRKLVKKLALMKHTRTATRFTPKKRLKRESLVVKHPYHSIVTIRRGLATECGLYVSNATVARDLHAIDFVWRVMPRGPKLTPQQRERRVVFGRRFLSWDESFQHSILYGDEKLFDTNASQRESLWVPAGSRAPHRGCEQFGPSVFTFIIIGVGFRYLSVHKRGTKIDAPTFRNVILKPVVPMLRNRTLMLDNAPCHQGASTCNGVTLDEWLRRRRVALLPSWPPSSPDGNPVEQVNGILGRRVQARGPVGEEELCAFIKAEFAMIPQSTLDALVMSCADRWERIVAYGGQTIKP